MNKIVLIGLAAALAAGAALAQTPPPPPSAYGAPQSSYNAPPPPPGYQGRNDGGRGFQPGGPDGFGRDRLDRGRFGGRRFWPARGGRRSLQDIERRNAEMFAQADANKDGRLTFEEFRQFLERRRLERQREMFRRFAGGQDSVTLDQLNARAAERMADRERGGPVGGPGPAQRLDRPPGR